MPQQPDQPGVQRTGRAMLLLAWIAGLVLLTLVFQDVLESGLNPNATPLVQAGSDGSEEVVLQRNVQGHYVADGLINGRRVTFLLDTGATDVAIPDHVADLLGLRRGQAITVKTANGNALAFRTRLDSVALGEMERRDVRATILSNMPGNEVLLGMSYLKQFELLQRGDTLTIRQ